jgi:hypothetical protein
MNLSISEILAPHARAEELFLDMVALMKANGIADLNILPSSKASRSM